jgi:hypothetical protein
MKALLSIPRRNPLAAALIAFWVAAALCLTCGSNGVAAAVFTFLGVL